ncbi:MAG: 50S ribosomal protein L32 [Bifidobacteriaceae bacterium]|nr:50S ribosomal protein L32 [Bifidobacteriaceae bacterium]MEE0940885.1 50S ribosomal protein L32 [Bifidobacteriaceae bacterium]
MALPKYKMSRANTHARRSQWKTSATVTVECSNCGGRTLPHTACPSCGDFRGRTYKSAISSRLA